MPHSQVFIQNLELSVHNKNLFHDFSVTIYDVSHIALIGRNGSGKSTLLKALLNECYL